MRLRVWFVLILLPSLSLTQGVKITRFIPGEYLNDDRHLVELSNFSDKQVNLTHFLLVTRDYSVRIKGLTMNPGQKIGITKIAREGSSLALNQSPDFLIRFHVLEKEGNYVALISPLGEVIDAFYYGPTMIVPFLPDKDTCITRNGIKIPFYLPPENKSVWGYYQSSDNPLNEFLWQNGKWTKRKLNERSSDIAEIETFNLRYHENMIIVKWETSSERRCEEHILERSEDLEHFREIARIQGMGDSDHLKSYSLYDNTVNENMIYYYRLRSINEFGDMLISGTREISTTEVVSEFEIDVISMKNGELNIRFVSEFSQGVRLKLYNDRMQEIAILFNDYVYAGIPGLLKINKLPEPGNYTIMAITDAGRYSKQIKISN